MTWGNDEGTIFGEILQTMDMEVLVVATSAKLNQRTQYIVEAVVILNCFHFQANL